MKKVILFLAFVTVSLSFAQTANKDSVTNPADVAFSKASISIEGGEVYPWGDLLDAVENSYYAGLGFRYTYWENVDGVVMFNYSYFKPIPEDIPYDGVHQFTGKLGLDWKWPRIAPLILGVGFTCNWTRADLEDEEKSKVYSLPGGTLTDNETEFGWYGRINVPFVRHEKFRIGLNVLWEELWTLPKRSDMVTAGIYVERSLW